MKALVDRLVTYRILRFDAHEHTYTTHPLIRNHYLALLTKGDHAQEKAAHGQIKDYYLSIAGDTPEYPTLEEMKPLIEAVYHACCSGNYDEGLRIYVEQIDQGEEYILIQQLGTYESDLGLLYGFFPNGNKLLEPQVTSAKDKSFILNSIGISLMSVGKPQEALPIYELSKKLSISIEDWRHVGRVCQNMADLSYYLGELGQNAAEANQAVEMARRSKDEDEEWVALSYLAWSAHLRGNEELAKETFQQAEAVLVKSDPTKQALYDMWGIYHTECLRRIGLVDDAQRIANVNLDICTSNQWSEPIVECCRILGDLYADTGQNSDASRYHEKAIKLVRNISERTTLIETHLSRGRWYARCMKDAPSAFSDLNEALGYAVDGGYRIYEADIRVALAWGWIVDSGQWVVNREKARTEAERAWRMSEEMGYYWGKVDAEEVLEKIRSQ